MRATDLQPIGHELAVKWQDGSETFLALETLRQRCPCAGCQGESDVLGNSYRPPKNPLGPSSFQLRKIIPVGSYAIQPVWGDGHATGIYSFDYLRSLSVHAPGE